MVNEKKKLTNSITNPEIEDLYEKALNEGALGGKLLGAGGGGFLLFYCKPEDQDRLRRKFFHLKEVNFKFDNQGSKIIYIGD